METKILRITESVCALSISATTELNVIAINFEEGEVITESREYGMYGQEVHRFSRNNLTQLMRTGWYQRALADGCTITYNLIDQKD